MSAKLEERKTDLYIGDLIYLLVKAKYELQNAPTPTEYEFKTKKRDTRSAKQIADSIVSKLTKGA